VAPATCPVCDHATNEPACPRCATILVAERAACPRCGTSFSGSIAVCDACDEPVATVDADPGTERAIRTLSRVPGFDEGRARALYARGFRNFADVIKLGLPDSAVRRGLHHTISRKVLLSTILPPKRSRVGKTTCLECHTTVLESETTCPACGMALGSDAEEAFIERRLATVEAATGRLSDDPDFRSMPDDVRAQILRAMGTMLEQETVTDEEFDRQIEAWRTKGFDVEPVLVLLGQHPNDLRDRAIRLIRAQIRKKRDGGVFKCPLCDEVLAPTVEECENCGARFA